ncbi:MULTISPECIES: IS982 family transposase [Streptomyces]|uniref:IS982 family transposase n=1 Tax=Streptomyces TaxID=1883 RepID=UPI0029BD92B5|nr:IS982 family transposase [Streptomyces europaeiscabiei]MDX3715744.1 IS982 family transposase [Streptomyces europaeiscabiei]WSG20039.1 IS982 family transposase [Streptomyces europaeiscabiei]
MTNNLDALLTALYVKSELVTLAVAQALLGFTSESRWLRFVDSRLGAMFPYVPRAGLEQAAKGRVAAGQEGNTVLAVDTDFWFDNHWIIDSRPVECGRSRPTVKRSDMAGWAGYGYCASHSRFFWGLRLFLVCTPAGMPVLWALANPKLDEREVLSAMLDREPHLATDRPGLLVIADKGYTSMEFEADLAFRGAELLRPSFKREKKRRGESLLKSVRHLIESVNDTLKGQLDLEQHGGRTFEGVAVRVAQRILAMAAAIWHNHKTGQPVMRSLIAYDS